MRNKIVITICLLLSGCAVSEVQAPYAIHFNEIEVRNEARRDIQNLVLQVKDFRRRFSCGLVLAGSFCSSGFRSREYEENAITLNWQEAGRLVTKGPLVVKKPDKPEPGSYKAVLILKQDGGFSSFFEPK